MGSKFYAIFCIMSFEKQRKIIRNHILGFGKEKLLEISHFYHTLPSFHYCSNFTIHLNDNALYFWLCLTTEKVYCWGFLKCLCLNCYFMLLNTIQIILEMFSCSRLWSLILRDSVRGKFYLKSEEKISILMYVENKKGCSRRAFLMEVKIWTCVVLQEKKSLSRLHLSTIFYQCYH